MSQNHKIKKDPTEIYKFRADGTMYKAEITEEKEYISLLSDFNKQNELLQLIKDKIGYTEDKSLQEQINDIKELVSDGYILLSGEDRYVSLEFDGEYVSKLMVIKNVEEKRVTDKFPNLLNGCHKKTVDGYEEDKDRLKAKLSTL